MDPSKRSAKYNMKTLKHIQRYNNDTLVYTVIEDKEAAENIEDIVSVEDFG